MKKILTTLACGAILAATANADMARVEMGVGAWKQTPSGIMSYTEAGLLTGDYTSDEKETTEGYVWMLIKHPIPVLPNIRLEYVSLEDSGIVEGKFKDFEVPGGLTTTLNYDMKQYDIIPYYNILDNTGWMTLDLGLDIKIVDTSYVVAPVVGYTGDDGSETIVIPLVYVRGRVEIPSTDIGLEADIKYITTGDATVYDIRAKIDYTLSFIPVVQPAIEVGYRAQKMDIAEGDSGAKMDMKYEGVYAGLMVRF